MFGRRSANRTTDGSPSGTLRPSQRKGAGPPPPGTGKRSARAGVAPTPAERAANAASAPRRAAGDVASTSRRAAGGQRGETSKSERGAVVGSPDGPASSRRERGRSAPSPDVMARARRRLAPPPAPWHPLPLSELAIVLGAVAMLASVWLRSDQGLVAGFLLIVAGTAEFSWREHRHGYRSHGALLSGSFALPVALAAWKLAGVGQRGALLTGAVVFFAGWSVLNASYRRARERLLTDRTTP
jgi:hypothetical protein